ncbi:MAG: hypothetical protein JNM86_08490 [Phycisphaerae bacterium]|nr:hypothetical protein [Phycisphaerae bacterium]
MNEDRHNWPTRGFASRLAAAERFLHRQRQDTLSRNAGFLATIDAMLGIEAWDGDLLPADVEDRYRSELARMSDLAGVFDDGSVDQRIARLRESLL